jgi:glutamate-1-semialdehyde 2,1-aminomutase
MEPVLCNSGCLMPLAGYLEGVRDLAARHGALLVFDEVITGFRMALGGAQSHYGVTPDLATFGKAVAGGLTLSVVAGRREIVEQIFSGVAFGGTFNGNPISLAAAMATLAELSADGGRPLEEAKRTGEALMRGIGEAARRSGIALTVTGFGTAFALHFTRRGALTHYRDTLDDDSGRLSACLLAALDEGIHLVPDGRFYVSTAHTEQDAAQTIAAMERAFRRLAS